MFASYLMLAFKILKRRPAFTAVSLFGISFSLLVLVVAIAILDQVTAPIAPETRKDRTLGVYSVQIRNDRSTWQGPGGYGLFDRYMRGIPGVERMSIFSTEDSVISYEKGQRIGSYLKRTDADFWKILEFTFLEGRPYDEQDVAAGSFVAVINETTRHRFFGNGQASGKAIEADGQRFEVIGVVPDVPMLRPVPFADIWVPVTTSPSDAYRRRIMGGFNAIFLAHETDAFPLIRDEFESRLRRVELPEAHSEIEAHPYTTLESVAATLLASGPNRSSPQGGVRIFMFWAVLGGLTFLFMLLPTLNLVNLNMSRILERSSEIGVRKAFGASSRILVVQFLFENVLLTLIGGALSLAFAPLVLNVLATTNLVPYAHFTVNIRVLLYAIAFTAVFGAFSGAYPAWRMSRLHPIAALKGGIR